MPISAHRSGKEKTMPKEEHLKDEAYFESIDLAELTSRMKRILDIRDRKY